MKELLTPEIEGSSENSECGQQCKVEDESTVLTQSGEFIDESSLSLTTSMKHKQLCIRADSCICLMQKR